MWVVEHFQLLKTRLLFYTQYCRKIKRTCTGTFAKDVYNMQGAFTKSNCVIRGDLKASAECAITTRKTRNNANICMLL